MSFKNSSGLYFKDQGAILARKKEEYMTVYAINPEQQCYVGLPESWWIYHLGFSPCLDVQSLASSYFDNLEHVGVIALEV